MAATTVKPIAGTQAVTSPSRATWIHQKMLRAPDSVAAAMARVRLGRVGAVLERLGFDMRPGCHRRPAVGPDRRIDPRPPARCTPASGRSGKRYEDRALADPSGQGIESVRPIRDEVRGRVLTLLSGLGVAPVTAWLRTERGSHRDEGPRRDEAAPRAPVLAPRDAGRGDRLLSRRSEVDDR
jgi:hypothetical protein